MPKFHLLRQGTDSAVTAVVDDNKVRLSPDDIEHVLGWDLQDEGFCMGPVCYPVPWDSDLVTDDGVDIAGMAELIGRPLAMDPDHRAAFLGTAAADRGNELASLQAPDFTLPDLDGKSHTLSDYLGKKILLVAYASW